MIIFSIMYGILIVIMMINKYYIENIEISNKQAIIETIIEVCKHEIILWLVYLILFKIL